MKIKIGYMESCFCKTMKTLTAERFEQIITSPKVLETMSSIEQEPDAVKKSKLKEKLPVVFYACQMPDDGKRDDCRCPEASGSTVRHEPLCRHKDQGPFAHVVPPKQGLHYLFKQGRTL